MSMYITANGEEVEIDDEQRDGDRYLVAKNVPIVKPMELDTGYVPEEAIEQSTEIENTHGGRGWEGTIPTVNHPRNDPAFSWHDPSRPSDDVVLAANEEVQETLGVGVVENDHFDGEFLRADIAVNADRAEEMGGEAADIVDALESKGPLEVSSQYLHAELPPGEYDGEHREDPKAIAAPDSVALIPNGRGVCSVKDGCGIAPGVTANVADHADAVSNAAVAGTDDPDKPLTGLMGEDQQTMDDNATTSVRQIFSGLASLLAGSAGPADTAAANETTRKRRLLQIAQNQEGFPSEFPFGDKSACIEEMGGEVGDPGAFCNAWYESSNAAGNESGDETTEAVTGDESSDSSVDNSTDHEMNATANTTFGGESVAEIMGVVGGTIEPQVDELMDEVRENLEDEYDADEVEEIMGAIGGILTSHVDAAIDDMSDELRWQGDEPGSNTDDYEHTANMERDDLIDEIAANSNIKRESLEGMGDTCLQTTHENIVGNDADGGGGDADEDDGQTTDDGDAGDADSNTIADMTAEELGAELRDQGFVTEDSVDQHVETAANQLEKEERAEQIVANSAEYDEEDVEWIAELPEKELERKERGATQTGGIPATGAPDFGATGNTDGVDTEDMPDLEVS